MKKIISIQLAIFFLSFLISVSAFSQTKQLTVEDGSYMNYQLFPKRISQLKWMGNSDNFSYVAKNKLVKGKATSTERDTIMTVDDLNAGMTDLNIDSLKRLPSITYLDDNKIRFTSKNKLFVADIISKKLDFVNEYDDKAAKQDIHPKTNAVAYTIDNNLFIAIEKEQIQLTNDEDKGIVNGQSVHRQEFGIYKGTFWSPEGNYLAFYRKDQTMVGDYPLVNIDTREATAKNIKYPMAGMTSEEVTLGVYDLKNKKTVFLKTGEPKDHYLTAVTWGPNEKYIYIAILNRDQNHLWLNQYDVATGDLVKTLFEEESPKYVEPEHPLYFLKTTLGRFVWFSERDGYNHLYLFNTDGEMIKQLTKGEWVVTKYLGTDPKEKKIFFQATKESPLEKNIYSVEIKSGKITRITPDHGTHSVMISKSGEYFIDSYSSTDVTREIKVENSKGKTVQV
jgi:dipeptidyl-peptidase-4